MFISTRLRRSSFHLLDLCVIMKNERTVARDFWGMKRVGCDESVTKRKTCETSRRASVPVVASSVFFKEMKKKRPAAHIKMRWRLSFCLDMIGVPLYSSSSGKDWLEEDKR